MKKILFYLCLLPCFLTGQTLYLSDAITVSTEGTNTRAPRIALLEDNRPVVYWGKPGSNAMLYLAIWDNGAFGDPLAVNTGSIIPDLWGGSLGPQIAAQGNTIFLVFEDYGQGIYCIKSSDGGQTFGTAVSVWDAPTGRVATLPSIAIDPNGNPAVSFITTNFSEHEAQYEITKSTDGGLTFPTTAVANDVLTSAEVCECCMGSIVAPSVDEVYITFRNNDDNKRDIWVTQSLDAGASFTAATDIDDTDWTTFSCPQSGPDMMVSGENIYSAFFTSANGPDIYFSSLNKTTMEAGNQFQIPALNGQNTTQNYPAIAGNMDTIGVVWQEVGDNGYDISIAWSVNGPADLTDNLMLVAGGATSQKHADIIFHDGLFHIVYEDSNLGRVMYKTAGFEEIVSIAKVEGFDFEVEINPNPMDEKSIVYFENKNTQTITANLSNANGQLIKTYSTQGNTIEINREGLPSGIHFLSIQKGNQTVTKKLVIK